MLRFGTCIRGRVLKQFLNYLFRDLARCTTNEAERLHRPETQHCPHFRAFQASSAAKPALACILSGCHPEHATVQRTVALLSTRSGRREASRSDGRREPPESNKPSESKDPARRQPKRFQLAPSGFLRPRFAGSPALCRSRCEPARMARRRIPIERTNRDTRGRPCSKSGSEVTKITAVKQLARTAGKPASHDLEKRTRLGKRARPRSARRPFGAAKTLHSGNFRAFEAEFHA